MRRAFSRRRSTHSCRMGANWAKSLACRALTQACAKGVGGWGWRWGLDVSFKVSVPLYHQTGGKEHGTELECQSGHGVAF